MQERIGWFDKKMTVSSSLFALRGDGLEQVVGWEDLGGVCVFGRCGFDALAILGDGVEEFSFVIEPRLDDVFVDEMGTEGLFDDPQTAVKLASVDPMGTVNRADGTALISVRPAEVLAGVFKFVLDQAFWIDLREKEPDDHIALKALDKACDDLTKGGFSADAIIQGRDTEGCSGGAFCGGAFGRKGGKSVCCFGGVGVCHRFVDPSV